VHTPTARPDVTATTAVACHDHRGKRQRRRRARPL